MTLGGLLVGPAKSAPAFARRSEPAAEQLGRQMLDAIASVLPESLAINASAWFVQALARNRSVEVSDPRKPPFEEDCEMNEETACSPVGNARESQQPGEHLAPTTDLMGCFQTYSREKPEAVALWCLGIGFVLGWKLKPW
ncbi:MAG: hypothetical protein EA381_00270 [Planctomycetaceae bacterium]|nr:MAG: hypothetical protein EA381_00270 [Planctomycetaceae bacterium]